MKRVITDYNWQEVDKLDGEALTNGDKINVVWPTGEISTETVVVRKSRSTVNDHGTPWEIPISLAYVEVEHNGAKALIRLANDKIYCERVK